PDRDRPGDPDKYARASESWDKPRRRDHPLGVSRGSAEITRLTSAAESIDAHSETTPDIHHHPGLCESVLPMEYELPSLISVAEVTSFLCSILIRVWAAVGAAPSSRPVYPGQLPLAPDLLRRPSVEITSVFLAGRRQPQLRPGEVAGCGPSSTRKTGIAIMQ